MLNRGEMYADLVSAPRFWEHFYVRGVRAVLDNAIGCECVAGRTMRQVCRARPFSAARRAYRLIYHSPLFFERAVDKCAVRLFYLSILKLAFQKFKLFFCRSHYQDPACLAVDAVHQVVFRVLFLKPLG